VRVLIVEDDTNLAATLREALRGDGFQVDAVHDGGAALSFLADTDVALVVLDRDLPVVDGDGVCRTLQATGHPAKVLMLTAAGTIADRVAGLDLGADDYLAKPFAYVELVARMRALLRRDRAAGTTVIERAGVRLDTARRLAERWGRPLRLTPKELGVLEALLVADGGYLSPEDLLDQAWDDPFQADRGVVKVTVYSLRKKLGPPPVILSEPGFGYRIAPDQAPGRE
jgi:DNA-binding response OmpR family regulator